jgi:hypothetical protein
MRKIIWLLILSFLVYSGIKFGMPYYRYVAFKSEVKEIARISAGLKEDEIKNRAFERAQELKIPIQKDDIELFTTEKIVQIRTSWFEVVDILGLYRKTLIFSIDSTE